MNAYYGGFTMTPARTIGTKLSEEQLEVLDAFIARFYPDMDRAKYLRYLIEQDMEAKRIDWPEYEFVDNVERSKTGLKWKSGRPPKVKG
jgi:hypothetical protein